jgi:hypothetical protein
MLRVLIVVASISLGDCARAHEAVPRPVPSELSPTKPPPAPSPAPTTAKLTTDCAVDTDCTMTTFGDDCCDHCGNLAVNAASLARVREHCSKKDLRCPAIDCPFQPATAHCENSKCVRHVK